MAANKCYNKKSMSKITKYLNQLIVGNVYDSAEITNFYSTDRSVLKVTPKLVAFPESTVDIRKLLRFFNQLATKNINIPVAIRGSGLDETGADLSDGLVISMEKLNHLMEIDTRERLVRVQAGITLKELNTALSVSGLTLPIGADENETIGSIIANHPIDDFTSKYGGIINYIERAEIILASGECIQTGRLGKYAIAKKTAQKTIEASAYREIYKLTTNFQPSLNQIQSGVKSFAGYPTITLASHRDSIDLLPLLVGSQGTLGVISEVILKVVPIKKSPLRVITTFSKLSLTLKFLELTKEYKPRDLNLCDIRILKQAEAGGKSLSEITRKLEEGYAVYACFDDRSSSIARKFESIGKNLTRSSKIFIESADNAAVFDEFANSISSYLNLSDRGEHVALLSKFSLPAEQLPAFAEQLATLEKAIKIELPIYGSYANGIYNIRPALDISDKNYAKRACELLSLGSTLICKHGGSLTGGSPEGRVKALISNRLLSDQEKEIYKTIKTAFDPNNVLGPSIKLGANTNFTVHHFRTTPSSKLVL